jgi:hypothetical protein
VTNKAGRRTPTIGGRESGETRASLCVGGVREGRRRAVGMCSCNCARALLTPAAPPLPSHCRRARPPAAARSLRPRRARLSARALPPLRGRGEGQLAPPTPPLPLADTYVGPALLVLPLFLISLVNLFVAGPPLKTIVLDSAGAKFGASLPFMRLEVDGPKAHFTLTPAGEMTHFFVVTCYTPTAPHAPLSLDAAVTGRKRAPGVGEGGPTVEEALNTVSSAALPLAAPSAATSSRPPSSSLQLLQPLLGHETYEVAISTAAPSAAAAAPNLPPIEYRLTYVPTRFTYTQIAVRLLFTATSTIMLLAYACAICVSASRHPPTLAPRPLAPRPLVLRFESARADGVAC